MNWFINSFPLRNIVCVLALSDNTLCILPMLWKSCKEIANCWLQHGINFVEDFTDGAAPDGCILYSVLCERLSSSNQAIIVYNTHAALLPENVGYHHLFVFVIEWKPKINADWLTVHCVSDFVWKITSIVYLNSAVFMVFRLTTKLFEINTIR